MSSLTRIAWKSYRLTQKIPGIKNITAKPGSLMERGLNKVLGVPNFNAAERVSILQVSSGKLMPAIQLRALLKATAQPFPGELLMLEDHEVTLTVDLSHNDTNALNRWVWKVLGKNLMLPTIQQWHWSEKRSKNNWLKWF